MNNLNSVILEGNLVRDPEANLTPKGTPVCKFSVASNRYYKSEGIRQSEVSYFDVEVWSKVAEACEKHLQKGRGVRVVGRLKQDRWTDEEGSSHYKVKVVGEHVEFKPQLSASAGPGSTNESEEEPLGESVEDNAEENMEEALS
ncbi:single-stranded DNA-binding protein [Oceanispirochaeta crateris]|uniref:Single-stranded DNA-binding protein n=1 Tax=Oceanispirochaeta crateris TaxID=2518645 RepID=A0A5C1QS78_9SPIO|nr:single-stranded DNA-binding protein [Oceanispirochaeta crateris]QEN09426.1 single-stranded DNA-binding protein [Oceanispirochaeta crateris]